MIPISPAKIDWDDATATLKSRDFGDIYFQGGQAAAESAHVFLAQNDLAARFAALTDGAVFTIAELGLGTGLNFLLASDLFLKTAPTAARLCYFSVEGFPLAPADLAAIHRAPDFSGHALGAAFLAAYPRLIHGLHRRVFAGGRVIATFAFADAAAALDAAGAGMTVDAWFLDGFAPDKNPAMWQGSLIAKLAHMTAGGGTFATFSAAGFVRRELEEAGFLVEKVKGYGRKRDMTRGRMQDGRRHPPKPARVAVVGGGIAGCAAAHALALRGVAVDLFEKNAELARETSGNDYGAVYPKLTAAPSPMGDFYAAAFLYARQAYGGLLNACGVFHLDTDAEAQKRHIKIAALFDGHAGFCRAVDAKEAAALTGVAVPEGGLFLAEAGFAAPRALCLHLAGHENITLRMGTPFIGLSAGKNAGGDYDAVVLATGAALASSERLTGAAFELLRGQTTIVPASKASFAARAVICHDGYFVPAQDGRHVLGATFDKSESAGDFSLRAADHARNLAALAAAVPALDLQDKIVAAEGKTGYRVYAYDRLPVAGAVDDNVYVLGALGGHGLTSAPLLGEMVASLICGEALPLSRDLCARLSPRRLQERPRSRSQS